jgi:hypothetical protein
MDHTEAVGIRGLDGRHRVTRRNRSAALLVALACLFSAGEAAAQYGNVCQTNAGACLYNPMPLGTPCACFTPSGQFPGVILGGGGGHGAQNMASPICRTYRGVCQIPGVAPVGTQCNCYGDLGQIVPP